VVFPWQWNTTPDLPIPEDESPYPDSDTMVELIEQGLAEADRELVVIRQELATIALNNSVESPNASEC